MKQATNVFDIFPHPQFGERAESFHQSYSLIGLTGQGDEKYSKRKLKGYTNRSCLFCGRGYPEAQFKTLAHLVSKLIGNSNLYSDFECDECNKRFSKLEGDLAAFLGISRSIVGMGNEKKTVGYKGGRLTARSRSFMDGNILIIAPEDVEKVNGISKLSYAKSPFVPFAVYKAMLKSAISLLGTDYTKVAYKMAFDILNDKKKILQGLVMSGYQLSFGTNLPFHVLHFRKKAPEAKLPTDVLLFHFQNHMISFPMPLHAEDMKLLGDGFEVIVPPPYFTNEDNMHIAMPNGFMRDFSSSDVVNDEEETVAWIVDDSDMQNAATFDPATGKIERKAFGQNKTKYIILVKPGMQLKPSELSELQKFIENEMESDA